MTNPGCERRTVLDAARVDLVALAERLGAPTQFGQSPFAIGQGNRFEQRIKEDGYAPLVAAINDLLGIFEGVDDFRSVNLERVPGLRGRALIKARAHQTADVLEAIANGDPDAPHVVDHGVTTLDVGGNTVYLEQDALAFRDGEDLRICEIKGFPIIDGTASPVKVGAAARQTAVYVASIQDTLATRGFDPTLVSSEVILVCPKNFSISPVAVLVDVDREVRALRRQLRRRIEVTSLGQVLLPVAEAGGKLLLVAVILGVVAATFGAALETTLSAGYTVAQFFGWTWGKFRRPAQAARFHVTMMICMIIGLGVLATGVDPVMVTEISVVFSAAALPLTYLPILIVSNDPDYMGEHVNGRALNVAGQVYFVLILVASLAAIPLLIVTGVGQ